MYYISISAKPETGFPLKSISRKFKVRSVIVHVAWKYLFQANNIDMKTTSYPGKNKYVQSKATKQRMHVQN